MTSSNRTLIQLQCTVCKNPLAYKHWMIGTNHMADRLEVSIQVEPCKHCLSKARSSAMEDWLPGV